MENNLKVVYKHAFLKRKPSGTLFLSRNWKPNIKKQEFFSDILNKKLTLEVSMKAKRSIRKIGGFDNYILLTRSK